MVLLVLLLAACGEDKTTEFLTATTKGNASSESPIVLEGTGQTETAPFRLNGGRYRSTWETFNDCYYSAELEPGLFVTVLNAQGATTGETFINNVKAGEYYVDMITGPAPRCRWKITLTKA